MRYVRLYADDDGETHFEDVEVPMERVDYATHAPPAYVSQPVQAARVLYIRLPRGWSGDWHNSPARQFGVVMGGRFELTASDGESRTLSAGDARLLEDVVGKGHRSRVVGDEDVLTMVVQLA